MSTEGTLERYEPKDDLTTSAEAVLDFPVSRIPKLDDESLKRLHEDCVLGANERRNSGYNEDADEINGKLNIVERVANKRGLTLPDHYEDFAGRTVEPFD